ncbi:MAG TPA: hypothetical protein VMX17_14080 [Candidatus Glassbacteria bacterium]|nr:hypothetical protein [Candidatus Glassbacteria bacterium]
MPIDRDIFIHNNEEWSLFVAHIFCGDETPIPVHLFFRNSDRSIEYVVDSTRQKILFKIILDRQQPLLKAQELELAIYNRNLLPIVKSYLSGANKNDTKVSRKTHSKKKI